MRPTTLTIEGFQSYLEPQTIDFTALTAASITGEVGAGKTTIIDAITYALYGEVRATGDKASVLHTRTKKMVVEFDFTMNDAQWRIRRTSTRTKKATTSKAYFHKLNPETGEWQTMGDGSGNIGPTNRAILDVVGLNFDAFRATALVEQGNSGAFAQADPATRHRIFANIIDLGKYAEAEDRARKERTALTRERDTLTIQIDAHQQSITDGDATQQKLDQAQQHLTQAQKAVTDVEAAVQTATARVEEHTAKWHEATAANKEREQRLSAAREALKHAQYRAATAEAGLTAARRAQDEAATRIDQLTSEITAAEEADRKRAAELERTRAQVQATVQEAPAHQRALARAQTLRDRATKEDAEAQEAADTLNTRAAQLQARRGDLTAKRDAARAAYQEEKARLDALKAAHNHGGSTCFTCGQALDATLMERMAQDLTTRLSSITTEGTQHKERITEVDQQLRDLEQQRNTITAQRNTAQRTAHQADLDAQAARTALDAVREAQTTLEQVTGQLAEISEGRSDNGARARSYRDQITALANNEQQRQDAVRQAQEEQQAATAARATAEEALSAAESDAGQPVDVEAITQAGTAAKADLAQARTALDTAHTAHAQAQKDVAVHTAESQRIEKVTAERDKLTDQRATLESELEVLNKVVEALSPSGVPRMIMNSEVEALNAELDYQLTKLSGGHLTASVATTRETKAGTTRNELTISVTAPDGTRAYETFSGGQKFLTDLALHQAMSKVLTDNRGKSIQTLFVDEGIGALEGEPKNAAIRGIMAMGTDHYDMSLVVTHDPDVVAAFPDQIEVAMQSGTSVVEVR